MPLIVLTADRPPELRGIGAGQTIDQLKLYGDAVRWFCEVGTTRPTTRACSTSARSPAAPTGGRGRPPAGPVHLNARVARAARAVRSGGVTAASPLALEARGPSL